MSRINDNEWRVLRWSVEAARVDDALSDPTTLFNILNAENGDDMARENYSSANASARDRRLARIDRSTLDGVKAAFRIGGPKAIAWPACSSRCDVCGKRRMTYQLHDDFQNKDRLCREHLIARAVEERTPLPFNVGRSVPPIGAGRPIPHHQPSLAELRAAVAAAKAMYRLAPGVRNASRIATAETALKNEQRRRCDKRDER